MSLPTSIDEALFLTINAPNQVSCVHVPRQISRPELLKLLPESWATACMWENPTKTYPWAILQPCFPYQTWWYSWNHFPKDQSSSYSHPVFFPSQINMLVDSLTSEPPIKYFPVYYFLNPETGHKYFDACNFDDCLEDCLRNNDGILFHVLNDSPRSAKPKKPVFSPSSCKPPPSFYHPPKSGPSSQPIRCYMFSSSN